MSPLGTWLEHLAPGRGARVGDLFASVPLHPVYRQSEEGLDRTGRLWLGAEWSLRTRPDDSVHRARVMVAVDARKVRAGVLARTLRTLDPGLSHLGGVLASRTAARRPDLDILFGADLGARSTRGKLYVLRPENRPIADFAAVTRRMLSQAEVDPGWTDRQIDLVGADPSFFALDLHDDGSLGGKIYFSFDHEHEVEAVLRRLGRPGLLPHLASLGDAVSDNPRGRLVVTVRARGDVTTDVTLHAHVWRLPPLREATVAAWERTREEALAVLGRPLAHSYVSWLDGPTPSESLYYQVVPEREPA